MTLALYGKSRKRQGSLLLAALLAIIVASVGGLAVISSAFAHHADVTGEAVCNQDGSWTVSWSVRNSESNKYMFIDSNSVNTGTNPTLAPDPATPNTGGGVNGYSFGTSVVPGSSASVTLTVNVHWTTNSNDTVNRFPTSGSQQHAGTVSRPSGCTPPAKIITKKVVTGTGANPSQNFTANIVNNGDNSGEVSGLVFSQTAPDTRTWNEDDTTDDFQVNEVSIPANWTVTGTYIADGDAACPSAGSGSWDTNTPSVASGGALNNIANGDTVTVCFRNSYTAPPVTQIIVKKVFENGDTSTPFFATIDNKSAGNEGSGSGLQFNPTKLTRPIDFDNGDNDDDFDVTEAAVTNWSATGWKVFVGSSEAACPSSTAGFGSGSGSWASGSSGELTTDQFNLQEGETATVCFRNKYTAPSQTTVDKYNDSDGTPNIGESFNYKLKFSVTGSATTSSFVAADQIPAVYTVGTVAPNAAGTPLHCAKSGNLVTCTLNSGAAVGDYIATIPVTIPAGASCGPVINDVFKDSTTSGNKLDSDTVNISGCGEVTIDKSNAVRDGALLKWTITVTNASAVTKTAIVYDPNTDLVPGTETCANVLSESPTNYYKCDVAANSSASFVLSTTYPGHANVCEPLDLTNTAYLAVSDTAGSSGATDTDAGTYHEDASQSAACVTIDKANATKVGNTLQWVVTLTNTSAIAQTVNVYDANSSFVSYTGCTNSVTESPADTYSCTVPASSQATITLSTPYGGTGAVCDGYQTSNTAWINGNQNASDTAQYSETATPDKSCITVVKEKSDTSEPPTWNIKITNTGDAAQGLYIQDDDTFLNQVVSGGSCTPGDTILGNGILCTVDANSTLILSVYKTTPVATCEGTDVSNTVKVWVGVFPAPPSGAPDFTADGGTFQDVAKNTELCNKLIQITKYYQLADGTSISGFYAPTAADLPTFTLTPNPWTGVGSYNVVDDANCDLVDNGANIVWTCSIPADANPLVTEQAAVNWVESFNGACGDSLVKEIGALVANVLDIVVDQQVSAFYSFCNYPVGSIRIIKNDLTTALNDGRPADSDWDFSATGPNAFNQARSIGFGGGNVVIPNVPLGNGYAAAETDGVYSQCPIDGPAGIHNYFTTNVEDGPLNITQPGQEITFTFRNEDCGAVLGTGSLHVFKVRDLNGNGAVDGSDTFIVWTVTITGPEFPGGQVFNVPAAGLHLNGIQEGLYTVTEAGQIGYTLVGVASSENGFVVSNSTSVTVNDGESETITFYNQPFGEIPVHKNAFTSHNGGPNVAAPNDDDGWTITLDSANCGIHQVKVTDANGDAVFTGLPLCNDYVVSEGAVNASSPGFVPLSADQFTHVSPNGVTLTFNNIKRTNDPICTVGCIPTTTPTATPTTPTSTPTTPPSTATPTNTTVPPTATPTLTGIVGGERTPGPGQPTPIAPSTGGGVLGGTAGGFNLLLILAGLLALTSGVSFLALGRKNRR